MVKIVRTARQTTLPPQHRPIANPMYERVLASLGVVLAAARFSHIRVIARGQATGVAPEWTTLDLLLFLPQHFPRHLGTAARLLMFIV
jgi:hypothetical protein